ncbi:hypothetical protein OAQ99_01670 [Candidatus Kapabacteria bacterium]|nr:hypothetical protein [Candidatus Kapabacteria bacterium]
MEVQNLNIDHLSELKLEKLIKRLRNKINDSKVAKASVKFSDKKSVEYSNSLKMHRSEYDKSISRLKKLRAKNDNIKVRSRLKQLLIENKQREKQLEKYQEEQPDKYRFISNFNKTYSVNTFNNEKEIFNTYL